MVEMRRTGGRCRSFHGVEEDLFLPEDLQMFMNQLHCPPSDEAPFFPLKLRAISTELIMLNVTPADSTTVDNAIEADAAMRTDGAADNSAITSAENQCDSKQSFECSCLCCTAWTPNLRSKYAEW